MGWLCNAILVRQTLRKKKNFLRGETVKTTYLRGHRLRPSLHVHRMKAGCDPHRAKSSKSPGASR